VEVEFRLTAEDMKAWLVYLEQFRQASSNRRPVPLWKLILVFVAIFVPIVYHFSDGAVGEMIALTVMFLIGVGVGCLGLFIVLTFLGRPITIAVEEGPFATTLRRFERGPWRLAISPEGVTLITDLSQSLERWPLFVRIGATEDHLFICNGPETAHIIPRRAFANETLFKEFIDLARRYHEEANRATGIVTLLPSSPSPSA
jgi:hypothetical protein